MKKHALRISLGLLVMLFFLLYASHLIDMGFLDRIEMSSYDLRLNLTLPHSHDARIVIVDIDEKSLAEEGHWPWSRNKLALLINNLFRHRAAVVGFDVVFAEKDESSGIKVLEGLAGKELRGDSAYLDTLANISERLDYDKIFGRSFRDRPVVLGYYFSYNGEQRKERATGQLPPPVLPPGTFRSINTHFVSMNGYGANLIELQSEAGNAGYFNQIPDADGVTRRIPMLMEYHGAYYEPLSVAVVRALFGNPEVVPGIVQSGKGGSAYNKLEFLKLADITIPVDDNAMSLVPYFGGQGTFPYISASDVLHDRAKPEDLDGAIVLVGTTSPGLMDQRAVPMSAIYPGVEVHANMIAGILDNKIRKQPSYAMGAEIVILLAAGLLLSLLLPFLNPLKSTLASVLVFALAIGINMWAWQNRLVLPLASSTVMIPLIFVYNMSYGFFIETRAKRKITGLFGQYVPRDLVVQMSRNPEKFSMEGESRELTVLFSDVRNFTTISESLAPKELSKMMNEYMSSMTSIIQKYNGTIDKYIGDAIMAFWGAPLEDQFHARNGILAALEMQQSLAALRPHFIGKGWPAIHIGVGLNTGVMRVGNMGSQFRIAYTVMGDAVNLGSRLEGITKEYGVGVIVGETTRNSVGDILFRELDLVRVKGKNQPVAIYEPIGLQGRLDRSLLDEISLFEQALQYYRAMQWDRAVGLLRELQRSSPQSRLYNLYIERIAHFRAEPPEEGWDGVFQFKTK